MEALICCTVETRLHSMKVGLYMSGIMEVISEGARGAEAPQ